MRNLRIRSPARAPKCLAPPWKWYHHIAQPSAHLKPPSLEKESPLLHREKNGFLKGLYFGISTRTALESPKSDIFQIWPKRVLGHVISCPEPKFEKRIPMGSVPNEWKEILMRDPIRWFKCKFKPPKNYTNQLTLQFSSFPQWSPNHKGSRHPEPRARPLLLTVLILTTCPHVKGMSTPNLISKWLIYHLARRPLLRVHPGMP